MIVQHRFGLHKGMFKGTLGLRFIDQCQSVRTLLEALQLLVEKGQLKAGAVGRIGLIFEKDDPVGVYVVAVEGNRGAGNPVDR